jgi:hypothetical protein
MHVKGQAFTQYLKCKSITEIGAHITLRVQKDATPFELPVTYRYTTGTTRRVLYTPIFFISLDMYAQTMRSIIRV